MHREGLKCKSINSLLENSAWYMYIGTSKLKGSFTKLHFVSVEFHLGLISSKLGFLQLWGNFHKAGFSYPSHNTIKKQTVTYQVIANFPVCVCVCVPTAP